MQTQGHQTDRHMSSWSSIFKAFCKFTAKTSLVAATLRCLCFFLCTWESNSISANIFIIFLKFCVKKSRHLWHTTGRRVLLLSH